jgi:hypothetical protein
MPTSLSPLSFLIGFPPSSEGQGRKRPWGVAAFFAVIFGPVLMVWTLGGPEMPLWKRTDVLLLIGFLAGLFVFLRSDPRP